MLPRMDRLKYSHVKCRQEGLETKPSERKKRYCRNYLCIVLFIIIICYYCFTNFWLTEVDNPFDDLLGNQDEYLTTQYPDEGGHEPGLSNQEDNFKYFMNTSAKKVKNQLPNCIKVKRFGRINLNTSLIYLNEVENKFPKLKYGGYYAPPNCSSKDQIAIIVAYRARPLNLAIFLNNLHPILMEQQIEYQIFVIEQQGNDLFNKGRLFNAGFKEAMKIRKFLCLVFHDLDLLPMYHEIIYSCPTLPRHMSTTIDRSLEHHKIYEYVRSRFGGVVSLTVEMFLRVNGYSNVYFGWGAEDIDIYWRLRAAGYPVVRYNKTIGVYTVLPHTRAPINKYRYKLLKKVVVRYKWDGLTNVEYTLLLNRSYHSFTHFLVDINPKKQNVKALTLQWASGNYSVN